MPRKSASKPEPGYYWVLAFGSKKWQLARFDPDMWYVWNSKFHAEPYAAVAKFIRIEEPK